MAKLRDVCLLILVFGVLAIVMVSSRGSLFQTEASYSDRETSLGNVMSAGQLDAPTLSSAVPTQPPATPKVSLYWSLSSGNSTNLIEVYRADESCTSATTFILLDTVAKSPSSYIDNGDDPEGLSPGSYCYKLRGALGDNWLSPYSNSLTATINKKPQTITIDSPLSGVPQTYGATFVAAGTASSGLPVTITTSGVCSGSDTDGDADISMTSGIGTCTISYNQAGDDEYKAAPQVTRMVTAQKAGQSITVTTPAPATATYPGSFSVTAVATSGLSVSITTSGACFGGSTSGTALITLTSGSGTCTVNYNQNGNNNYNSAPQVTSNTTVSTTSTGYGTLFPQFDKFNSTGTGNEWKASDEGSGVVGCGTGSTTAVCASRLDEDIDSPTADHVYNGAASLQRAEFDLTDAPSNLQTLTKITARFEGRNGGSQTCQLTLSIYQSNGVLVGSGLQTFTPTTASYSFVVSGLTLSKSIADGLYVRIENTSGKDCQVSTINLDIEYLTP